MAKSVDHDVILCDFDGTITDVNVGDALYSEFSEEGLFYAQQWERGEISSEEEYRKSFATITASKEEMESFILTRIDIDPGIHALIAYCVTHGIHFAILSDGLRWYIEYLLRTQGLKDLHIFSAEINFTREGYDFSFPWHDEATPKFSIGKARIIRSFQKRGLRVAYIGDGMNDLEAAKVADAVFAKNKLIHYCKAEGIDMLPFDSLTEVTANLTGTALV